MKLIKETEKTSRGRAFEIRVYEVGDQYVVTGYENNAKVTMTYTVDSILNSDLVKVHGFCPYESLVGLVARDIDSDLVSRALNK